MIHYPRNIGVVGCKVYARLGVELLLKGVVMASLTTDRIGEWSLEDLCLELLRRGMTLADWCK